MDYTVETNIFRAKMANKNHLQQQWFQISYPLLTKTSHFQYARIRDKTEGTEMPLAEL